MILPIVARYDFYLCMFSVGNLEETMHVLVWQHVTIGCGGGLDMGIVFTDYSTYIFITLR